MEILRLCVLLILALGTEGKEFNEKQRQLVQELEELIEIDREYERLVDQEEIVQTEEAIMVKKDVIVTGMLNVSCYHTKVDYIVETIEKTSLKAHNVLRAKHNVPLLVWDMDLANGSQAWAEHMAGELSLVHSSTNGTGENLSQKETNMPETCYGPSIHIKEWYEEISKYNFTSDSGAGTGHFTQVVWKSTQKVGCGMAVVQDGDWIYTYYCCRYKPAGNNGKNAVNVIEPASKVIQQLELEENGKCDYSPKCKKYRKSCHKVQDACYRTCTTD